MADLAEKLSPLHELAMPRSGSDKIVLSERLCDSLVQVQAWPDTVEEVEKRIRATRGKLTIMASGPGRWLVEDDKEGLENKLRRKIGVKLGAITGLTHGRVVVSVSGEKATWLLASGIAIDFDLLAFPVGTTQASHHHEIGLTIHRTGQASFDLYVFTSLVRSFWHWLEKASGEVGYSVI
ncbi:MAG: sarcosine oxidase subunit gamma family protein [Rhizobiaceae bacterium]